MKAPEEIVMKKLDRTAPALVDQETGERHVGRRSDDIWEFETIPSKYPTTFHQDYMVQGEQVFTEIDGEMHSYIVEIPMATTLERTVTAADLDEARAQIAAIRFAAGQYADAIVEPGGVERFEAMANLVMRLEAEIEEGEAALAEEKQRQTVELIKITKLGR